MSITIEEGLRKMQEGGITEINIYWIEENEDGALDWWVDVCEDLLNKVCETNWVWDVISEEAVKNDEDPDSSYGEIESDIIVGEPFSKEVVRKAVEGWLRDREIDMVVNVVYAEGSVQMQRIIDRIEACDMFESVEFERI